MFFSKLFSFFKRKDVKAATAAPVKSSPAKSANNKQVEFNKKLVKDLMRDHKILVSDFTTMITAAESDGFEYANKMLGVFAKKITEHLELENLELYVYLEFSAGLEQEDKSTMRDFRNEMASIATAVVGFINTYTNDPISAKNKEEFLQEANAAAGILVDRIEREEAKLYPMYGRYKK